VIHRRGEAGHVGDHAAPYGDQHVAAGDAGCGHLRADLLDDFETLGCLAVGNRERHVLTTRIDVPADAVLGDDDRPAGIGRQHRGQFTADAMAHHHRIAPVGQRNLDDLGHRAEATAGLVGACLPDRLAAAANRVFAASCLRARPGPFRRDST